MNFPNDDDIAAYFNSHKAVSDFADGEIVYLFVDGMGEVATKYSVADGSLYGVAARTTSGLQCDYIP